MDQHKTVNSRAGFVAVAGRPNTGKSSLINALLGQKVAAVSAKPQTTRKNQLGILSLENSNSLVQIIFIDTPGIHKPKHKLGEKMVEEATGILNTADLAIALVDGSTAPEENDRQPGSAPEPHFRGEDYRDMQPGVNASFGARAVRPFGPFPARRGHFAQRQRPRRWHGRWLPWSRSTGTGTAIGGCGENGDPRCTRISWWPPHSDRRPPTN